MKINVQSYSYTEPVTLKINDECNHAGAYEQELDYGYPDRYISDWVDDWRLSLVCNRCDWTEIIEREPDYE